jgi:hypothetical protein
VPPKIIMVIIINHVLIFRFLKVGRNGSYSNILELEDDLLSEIEYPRILSV